VILIDDEVKNRLRAMNTDALTEPKDASENGTAGGINSPAYSDDQKRSVTPPLQQTTGDADGSAAT
jgi:hypothetical protein